MRKIIAVILCLVMALGLVGCNQPAANNEGDGEKEVRKSRSLPLRMPWAPSLAPSMWKPRAWIIRP